MKFYVWAFLKNLSRECSCNWTLSRITLGYFMVIMGTLREALCTFMVISFRFFFRKQNFQTKVVEKNKTYIFCSIAFPPKNHAIYEIMCKSIVELSRPQMAVQCLHFACWIPDTHTQYLLLFHKSNNGCANAPKSAVCTYIACLACVCPVSLQAAVSVTSYKRALTSSFHILCLLLFTKHPFIHRCMVCTLTDWLK
jgi:hypothetical protein